MGREENKTGVGDSFQKFSYYGKNQDHGKRERLELEKDLFAFAQLEDGEVLNIFICRRKGTSRNGEFEELDTQFPGAYEKSWNL